jgi:hypothetical protein
MNTSWLIRFCGAIIFLLAITAVQAGDAVKSGPQPGEILPGSFAPFNINGEHKNKYHCLVCKYEVNPVVMVFAREPAEGKDQALTELLKKLDEAVGRHQKAYFGSFVVFLSPDAKSSATDSKAQDSGKLVQEAKAREDLIARLQARAEKLKNVVVCCFPAEGPKDYKINEKAEVTVIFYNLFEVLANFAHKEGQLQTKDVEAILKKVDDTLDKAKKK